MSRWKQKRSVARRYDQSAKAYDAQYREEQDAKIQTILEMLRFNGETAILDLGCGTGLLFDYMAGKTDFMMGVDVSKDILKEAMEKAKQHGNISLTVADADYLPFPSKAFDTVLALTILQNMPNPSSTLNEIERVSKKGATIVVTGLKKSFTEERLRDLIAQAGLKVAMVKVDKQMREYVSICTKSHR